MTCTVHDCFFNNNFLLGGCGKGNDVACLIWDLIHNKSMLIMRIVEVSLLASCCGIVVCGIVWGIVVWVVVVSQQNATGSLNFFYFAQYDASSINNSKKH